MKVLFLCATLLVAACAVDRAESDSESEMPARRSDDADASAAADEPPVVCVDAGATTLQVAATILTPDFLGFGAQYNQNLYAPISALAGIRPDNVGALEEKAIDLGPNHVRIFFDSNAFADPSLMTSFRRTVDLATRAGATLNITYWHGPYTNPADQMDAFAGVLAELASSQADRLWVTIQNEVNDTQITMQAYESLYRALDASLAKRGVRDRFALVAGDLVATNQPAWLGYIATHFAEVVDGYSIHVYWDHDDTTKLVSRLATTKNTWNALPDEAKRPLYVTEFGVRGIIDAGEPQPGHAADGTPYGATIESAFQHAWFDVEATRRGFVTTVKWDAYASKYDGSTQAFWMIGAPDRGAPLTPLYGLTRMLARAVKPHSRVHDVVGDVPDVLVTAIEGPNGEQTIIGIHTGTSEQRFTIGGLVPGSRFHALVWNQDGQGHVDEPAELDSATRCVADVVARPRAVFVLTTIAPPP